MRTEPSELDTTRSSRKEDDEDALRPLRQPLQLGPWAVTDPQRDEMSAPRPHRKRDDNISKSKALKLKGDSGPFSLYDSFG